MRQALARLWRVNGGLLVLLSIVAVTGVVNFFVVNPRAFLNFYYLPVLFGAYRLGGRKGVLAALLSSAFVVGIALMNPDQFGAEREPWMRWLDIGTWGCFLVLTSYMVGSLYDLKQAQLQELRQAYQGVVEIMAKFIDSVDRFTHDHSRRVADYSVELATAMGLSNAEIENVRVAAFLHDVGKIDVSTEVLSRAARGAPGEGGEAASAPEASERLVRSVGGILRHVIPMVSAHRERWDGTGYHGLKGESIPLGARIISVADAYDAMVTDRPYRKGRSHYEAMEIIREASGTQFDPQVVEVFLRVFSAKTESDLGHVA